MLWTERVSMLAADEHLDADAGGVEAHRVVHVHGDLLVGQLLGRMLGPPLARSTIGFCESAGMTERRMPRVQNSASQCGSSGTIERSMRSSPVVGPWK